MLIGVVADTHDECLRTEIAVSRLIREGAVAIIHCGDITTRQIIEICSQVPFYFVFGNHDCDNVPELEQAANDFCATCLEWGGTVELAGRTIAVTHGHMKSDVQPLLLCKPDFLLTGHFHESADWMDGNVHRVCPGALHRADTFSAATIDLNGDVVSFLSIE